MLRYARRYNGTNSDTLPNPRVHIWNLEDPRNSCLCHCSQPVAIIRPDYAHQMGELLCPNCNAINTRSTAHKLLIPDFDVLQPVQQQ